MSEEPINVRVVGIDAGAQELLKSLIKASRELEANSRSSASGVNSLTRELINLGAAFGVVKTIDSFIARGLQFNQLIQTSTLGIATLITAAGKLTTTDGRVLQGAEALTAGIGLARAEIDKLRIAGIRTAATTEQLVVAFQEAVGAGLKTGLSLEQIRNFTVQVSQAAIAIGLPFNQLNQEVRSILNATIDRNSRIAKALQLTNEEVRLAKEQGRLAQLLTERFQAFSVAGEESLQTMAALKSNITDALDLFAGEQTKPLFTQLTKAGQDALAAIFDLNNARIQESFRGLILAGQDVFRQIGSVLASGIGSGISGAKSFSEFLASARPGIQRIAIEAGFVARQFGLILASIGQVVMKLNESGVTASAFSGALRLAGGAARLVADNMGLILSVFAAIKLQGIILNTTLAAMANPIQAAIIAATVLLSIMRAVRLEQERQNNAVLQRNEQFREESVEVARLVGQYKAYAQILRTTKDEQQRISTRQSLATVTARLLELEPQLRRQIGETGDASLASVTAVEAVVTRRAKSMIDVTNQLMDKQEFAQHRLNALNRELEAMGKATGPGLNERRTALLAQVETAKTDLQFFKDNLAIMARTGQELLSATAQSRVEVEGILAQLTPREGGVTRTGRTDTNDPIQRARGQLTEVKADAASAQSQLSQLYQEGKISATDYYGTLLRWQMKVLDAEEALHKAEVAVGTVRHDEGMVAQAKSQIEAIEDFRRKAVSDANNSVADSDQALEKIRLQVAQDTATALGQNAEASGAAVGRKYAEALTKAFGEQDFQLVMDIFKLIDLQVKKGAAEALSQQEQTADAAFRDRIQRIQNLQQTAAISGFTAQRQTAQAYRDQIALLSVLLEKRQALGLQDEKSIQANMALSTQIDQLNTELKLLTDTSVQLGVAIQAGLEQGLTGVAAEAMHDFQTNASNTGSVFRQMADSILRDIDRIIAKMLAMAAVNAALNAFANIIIPDSALHFADGGLISGPGGPRDDRIAIAASAGEFVVNARGYQAFPELVEAINDYGRTGAVSRGRRYAQGGAVAGGTGGQSAAPWEARLRVTLGPDLISEGIESDKGQRATLRVIQANKQSIRRLLGTA